CDGWECGPDDSKSLEKLRDSSQIYREAFAKAGRNPNDLIVRAHLPVFVTADGKGFDYDRMFAQVPAMREAGVNEFAGGVTGRLEGLFGSMDAIERHINKLAEYAAKY